MKDEQELAAGDFSSWLADAQRAIDGEGESVVPCAGCTACCTSSQFIHIAPDETDTLRRIPAELLFPAPRMARGHVLLGYDERGHCPMLIDNRCSIYDDRPRTCRTYDCRVFPAAGIDTEQDQDQIARRARRWRFGFPTESDRTEHEAVRAAAAFLDVHPELLPPLSTTMNATQLAVLAIDIHHLFLLRDEETGRSAVGVPAPDAVRAAVMSRAGAEPPSEA